MSSAPHDKVALTVVRFLGIASIIGLLVVGGLCYVALQYEGDGSTIAVVAIVGNLASAALASLGSILASTGKSAAQPVEVVNPPDKPANVVEQPAPVVPAQSEFGYADPVHLAIILLVLIVVLVAVGVLPA